MTSSEKQTEEQIKQELLDAFVLYMDGTFCNKWEILEAKYTNMDFIFNKADVKALASLAATMVLKERMQTKHWQTSYHNILNVKNVKVELAKQEASHQTALELFMELDKIDVGEYERPLSDEYWYKKLKAKYLGKTPTKEG